MERKRALYRARDPGLVLIVSLLLPMETFCEARGSTVAPNTAPGPPGKDVKPGEFATTYDITLTPLSCLLHLDADHRQAHYRRVVHEIDDAADAENKAKGRTPMGVQAILNQDPHHRPDALKRSPAPLVHAHDKEKREAYLAAYKEFVINYRAAAANLVAKAKQIVELFPDWAFPPPLPFKATAT
jgi:hypothetical protein